MTPPDDPTRTGLGAPTGRTATGDHRPAAPPLAAVAPPGYELLDEIGHGGMGVVYRARDLALGRDVAVKLLRGHYPADSPAARRFVDEARITGQLQHPGIPPVHQVGTAGDGRPFLVMKLIKGRTLDALLKERPAPAADRGRFLAVFEQVCQAVAYAHAHQVIHRDLKPQNVMVGAFGEVQVMDWGLAKVLGGVAAPRTEAPDSDAALATEIRPARDVGSATEAGSLLGTPAYMPPEQAIGAVDQTDARSDVFGLGAVLCAVLTGRPPYVGGTAESTRQLAARAKLGDALARLDGCGAEPDLVALCKRCLAAEKGDRPADAGAVAAAVAALRAAADERVRQAELTEARAAAERKRRRALAALGAVAFAAVAAGGAASFALWRRAEAARGTAERALGQVTEERGRTQAALARVTDEQRETERALGVAREEEQKAKAAEAKAVEREGREKTARETAEAVTAFMREVFAQGSAAGQASPTRRVNRGLTVKEAMDHAATAVGGRFPGRPEVEAAVRTAVGSTYHELGAYPEAEAQFESALTIRRQALGGDHPDTLGSANDLAALYHSQGRYADAEPLFRAVLAGLRKAFGDAHPHTLGTANNLAQLYKSLGRYAEAEPLYREALAGYRQAHGGGHPSALTAANNLAVLLWSQGRYAEAEPLYREALAGRRKALGDAHPDTLASMNNLAFLYEARGRAAAAEALYREAVAGRRKVHGDDHPDTLGGVSNLAVLLFDAGRYGEAVPLFDEAVRGYARRPELAGGVPTLRAYLGLALLGAGKPADAEPHLLAGHAVLMRPKTLAPRDHNRLRLVTEGLADMYNRTDRPVEAAVWRDRLAALPPEIIPLPRLSR